MKIVEKNILTEGIGPRIVSLKIESPSISRKALPGQFVALMVKEEGERVPLTIVDSDKDTITLIFQEAGLTTRLLGKLEAGDSLFGLAGPLGHPTEIPESQDVILVGGGVGIAEVYPVAKALQVRQNKITAILGARTKAALILEKELKAVCGQCIIATDDGSYGVKGFVTTALEELLAKKKYDLVYCVGPIPMMKSAAVLTKRFGVKTVVSLNAVMVDATGMCGCCRVTVAGQMKFSCVDGPDFDAHKVDWDELEKRNCLYKDKEAHICSLLKKQ